MRSNSDEIIWRHWFYTIGGNLVATRSRNKKPIDKWGKYQQKDIGIDEFEKWIQLCKFNDGCAVMTGRLRRGRYKDKFLICIDLDNKEAIDEFLYESNKWNDILQLSNETIVEKHLDDNNKAHVYFITEKPIKKRNGVFPKENTGLNIPKIEVKSDATTIVTCSPSIHKNGRKYEIIGTKNPLVLNNKQTERLENIIDTIYKKFNSSEISEKKNSIKEVFQKDFVIYQGQNRQLQLLRVMRSLLKRNEDILSLEDIKGLAYGWNNKHCKPPLSDSECEEKWKGAIKYLKNNNKSSLRESGKSLSKDKIEEDSKKFSTEKFLTLIMEKIINIFSDETNETYVTIRINDHVEHIPLKSKKIFSVIRNAYFEYEGKTISDQNIEGFTKLIDSKWQFDGNSEGDRITMNLRTAKNQNDDNIFYYDLTNPKWEIIEITKDGWNLVENNELPIFKRYESNSSPQIYPLKEYEEGVFDKFLKLINLHSREEIILFSVYLISLFIPEIPKPMLILNGTWGGAKSTAFELIKRIIDPGSVNSLAFPNTINELLQALNHHYVNFFDNVSYVSKDVSDILCRTVTGAGNIKRGLYTDDIDIIYRYKRVIGINGINVITTRADFHDRSLNIKVKRIEKKNRKKEAEINREFEKLRPGILGFILDIVSKTIAYRHEHLNETILKNGLPRMADFAEWGEIISRCLGYKYDEFIITYEENIDNQNNEVIESSPVAKTLMLFMSEEKKILWQGTPTELLMRLNDIVDQIDLSIRRSHIWPKTSSSLTTKINEISPILKEKGLEINTGGRDNHGDRYIEIKKLLRSRQNELNQNNGIRNEDRLFNPHIARIGSTDLFACVKCGIKDDIHYMKQHNCSQN